MSKIVIVGLGPGSPKYLTRAAQQHLQGGFPLYFRTMKHPSARCFASGYVRPVSFDSLYEAGRDFEQVYWSITKTLLKAASHHGTIIYAVPGHPHVGEATVERLIRICPRLGIKLKIIDGLSFLEPLLSVLKLDLLEGVTVIDALAVDRLKEPCKKHLIVAQVYSRSLASRVKLKLLDLYPPNHPVTVVQAAGMAQERSWKGPLYALDRRERFDHFSTICLTPSLAGSIGDLVEIMARLRAEDGCPWDREQTHHSLRQYLIEEAYEVVAAIDSGRDDSICEELGDLLLQVVFHSQIAREEERFDLARVIETIVAKLIRRHPHVFGEETAADASGVKVIWEAIKEDERKEENTHAAISVDHALPALLKAFKLQKRAAADGFDWPTIDGPLAKAREELLELEEACRNEDRAGIEEELGDYLFTVVNLARFLKVNPELALGKTIAKFVERYQYVLTKTELSGRPLSSFSLEELDKWWEEAKKIRKMSK
jgi:tetrapyrrole methylase family protein / MazG family protein